jgi:hypothetical protein
MSAAETWKDIPGYEGLYEVSDAGRFKRLPRRVRFVSKNGNESWRITTERVGSPNLTREGYAIAHLMVNSIRTVPTVHSLVMAAFVGPRPTGLDINHINGVKTDNRLCNLEYLTRTENHNHAVRTGLNKQAIRVIAHADGQEARLFYSISSAAKSVGLTSGSILYAIRKGTSSHGSTWTRA